MGLRTVHAHDLDFVRVEVTAPDEHGVRTVTLTVVVDGKRVAGRVDLKVTPDGEIEIDEREIARIEYGLVDAGFTARFAPIIRRHLVEFVRQGAPQIPERPARLVPGLFWDGQRLLGGWLAERRLAELIGVVGLDRPR